MIKLREYSAPGMTVENVGIQYGSTFTAPSYFAEAFVGFPEINYKKTKREVLISELEEAAATLQARPEYGRNIPVLAHLLTSTPGSTRARATATYDIIRSWLIDKYGTAKLLDRPMVKVNSAGHLATHSLRNVAGLTVLSREMRDPISVEITDPFIVDIEDAWKTKFDGGTERGTFSVRKSAIFSDAIDCDQEFWNSLNGHQQNQYKNITQVVEFARASALTALRWTSMDPTRRAATIGGANGGSRIAKGSMPIVPYHYELYEPEALEHVAYRNAPKRVRRELKLCQSDSVPLRELDWHQLRAGVEEGGEAESLLGLGKAARTVLIGERNFGEYWPIIDALAAHMHEKGRVYRGATMEFVGTPFETPSLVYNFPRGSAFAGKDIDASARILFGGAIGLPKIMYKTSNPKQDAITMHDHSPFEFLNVPKEIRYNKRRAKSFCEIDWRTNKHVQTAITSPGAQILARAANYQLAFNPGRVTTPREWTVRYKIEDRQNR